MSLLRQYLHLVEQETLAVPNQRQMLQRAKELAQQMGMDPNNLKVQAQGGVPVIINGRQVDPKLYTQSEIRLISVARQMRQGMQQEAQPGKSVPGQIGLDWPTPTTNAPAPSPEQVPSAGEPPPMVPNATQPWWTRTPSKFEIVVPKGQKGPDIADLQKGLEALDPNALPGYGVDGFMGDETSGAIRNFQKANGLPETGQADKATVSALNQQLFDKGIMAKLTPSTQKDVIPGKVKKGSNGQQGSQSEQPTPAQQTTPADPNSIRPEVQAMADLLRRLAQDAGLKESQYQSPAEQIARYRSILEYSEDLKEASNVIYGPWNPQPSTAATAQAAAAQAATANSASWAQNLGKQLAGVGSVAGKAGAVAKKVVPYAAAGYSIWGLGSEVSNIKSDLDAGDYGSAALSMLSALAYATSVPLAFASTMAGGVAGVTAGLAGAGLSSWAASRREGRGKRELVDAVKRIQSKLRDPNSGFTTAESKLLNDSLQAVKVQLIRNNIEFD